MMPYIIHAGLILAACLVFYKILLQKETFFRLNRYVLIACLLLSFGLPLIEIPQQWSFREVDAPVTATPFVNIQNDLPATTSNVETNTPVVSASKGINGSAIITWAFRIYWLGVIIFAINFLLQVITLLYRAYTRPVIKDGIYRIVELSGDTAPCSFGNNIFINPGKYDWETYTQILQHEKIHVQQRHTLDLLFAELVIIFQWFNPFAWWYRKELENNLEFLTDDQFLHHPEVEKTRYQLSLLKVSAPHFPLSLTTNYNQSLLKKRVAMMNAKKSNMHTTWKYLFLFPVLVLSVCLLNDPIAKAQSSSKKANHFGLPREGYWFATIKEDKVNMQFKSDDEDKGGTNNTTFKLSDFKGMPLEGTGTFTVTRDAGTIEFTGKIEGKQGMGRYKFQANKSYEEDMKREGISFDDENDQFVFFMIDVKKSYVAMLKKNGYTKLDKDDVIPMAALQIDETFIQSMKKAGFKNLSIQDLIPLKSLGIDEAYVQEIRQAGYPNITPQQLITFKAQKIDGKYLADIRKSGVLSNEAEKDEAADGNNPGNSNNNNSNRNSGGTSIDNVTAFKALEIDDAYIKSLKDVGYGNLSGEQLISMKGIDITSEYILTWQNAGHKDLSTNDLISLKAQKITPEYLSSFASVGFPKISVQRSFSLKALGVTPEYIKGFHDAGFKDVSLDNITGLKSQNITPARVNEYRDLGFENFSLDDIVGATATGTTPSFIKSMRAKGHDFKSLNKYITLKTLAE